MPQLIYRSTSREQRYLIQKRIVTVGTEPANDVLVSASAPGLVFTVMQTEKGFELIPGKARVRVNGTSVSRTCAIRSCDRVDWDGGAALFLESAVPVGSATAEESGVRSLNVLQNLASTLQGHGAFQAALHQLLDALVEMGGAEVGYLLQEMRQDSGWELLATCEKLESRAPGRQPTRRELFSDTILQEALTRGEPVHVENIIGHPWAEAASVIEARIFSAACFPLSVGGRAFGAVFLYTRSPGKVIKRQALGELSLLATQAALMLASQAELRSARSENARLKRIVDETGGEAKGGMVAVSAEMDEVARKVRKLAPTPLSVLILGETGSGKEVIAREIHASSERASGPFVAVNCAAIPATLLESTLFGHEKGAFTGAVRAQPGKFSQANGGTLLLDEIGDLPLDLQAKLLRVLQEKCVEPLGSARPQAIDVRVLAATHQDIETQVQAGKFRQDLYFRLKGAILKLPALRERRTDIVPLAEHFLRKAGSRLELSPAARAALEGFSWPGNVRELEQVMTRAAFLADGPEITAEDLELDQAAGSAPAGLERAFADFSNLEEAQNAFTRDYVQQILSASGGRRGDAARRLGISERTLYRILASEAGPDTSVRMT